MIKVFGHYFHRRTVLQVVCEAVLIGLVSAVSLWLQRGPNAVASEVMAEGVFIGGVVALAFCFSAVVGVVFGFFPARRAARMDPIEALRHQ